MVGADLLAVGRELAERIAAAGQRTQHALLVIDGKSARSRHQASAR